MNEIPKELICKLVSVFENEYGLSLQINRVDGVGGGCNNNASRISTSTGIFFLKWNWQAPLHLYSAEANALKLFNATSNEYLIFPKPFFSAEVDLMNHCPAFILTNWIESKYTVGEEEKLGRGLACFHRNTSEYFGFNEVTFCGASPQENKAQNDWLTFFIRNRLAFQVELIKQKRIWEVHDDQLFERFLTKLPSLIPSDGVIPSLVHGDLWSGNILYSPQGPALVDPAPAYCHREYELGIMLLFGGFSKRVFDAYSESWPLEPGWKERANLYQLYHLLNHYNLFGGGYKLQAMQIIRKYL